VGRGIAALFL